MSRLTLRLPETLHKQLVQLAESEGVSLNQYIVYALTRQLGASYSVQVVSQVGVEQQKAAFEQWLQDSIKPDETKVAEVLAARELVEPEAELTPDMIERFQSLIHKQSAESAGS